MKTTDACSRKGIYWGFHSGRHVSMFCILCSWVCGTAFCTFCTAKHIFYLLLWTSLRISLPWYSCTAGQLSPIPESRGQTVGTIDCLCTLGKAELRTKVSAFLRTHLLAGRGQQNLADTYKVTHLTRYSVADGQKTPQVLILQWESAWSSRWWGVVVNICKSFKYNISLLINLLKIAYSLTMLFIPSCLFQIQKIRHRCLSSCCLRGFFQPAA